jgi:thiol:disulfide interchange protein DsbD
MEEHVWPDSEIFEMIENDYVLISLYVDDSKALPEEEQVDYTSKNGKVRTLATYGNKWSTLQTETFAINSQPYYVLLSPDGRLLNHPRAYTPDVDEYRNFLECGLDANEQLASEQ